MEEDLSVFLDDFAVPVQFNGQTFSGVLDCQAAPVLNEFVMASNYLLNFPTASVTGVQPGSMVTIGNKSYRVSEVFPVGDGAFSNAHLSEQR